MNTLGKISLALLSSFILVSANVVSADSYLKIGFSSAHKQHKGYGHGYKSHYYGHKTFHRSHYKRGHKHHHSRHGHHSSHAGYFVGGLVLGGVLSHALHTDHHDSYRHEHSSPRKRVVVHRSYTRYVQTNRGKCYRVTEYGYGRSTLKRVPRRNCR